MNYKIGSYLLGLTLIGSTQIISAGTCCGCAAPSLRFRSQSENAARELAGWFDHINLSDQEDYYGSFAITPEYTRSFRPNALTQALFADSLYDCKRIAITGTNVATRNNSKDWAAEHFYLSDTFNGEITFKPRIENFLVDFNLYFGLNNIYKGLFARIHAPIAWTKWDLNAREHVYDDGTSSGSHGYDGIWTNPSDLLTRFFDYSCSEMITSSQFDTNTVLARNAYPLTCAKICPCSKRKTAVSDIQAAIGWNYLQERYHVGAEARLVAPTGTRPNAEYLFEPIIGNGKHWELGVGLTGHVIAWESSDNQRSIACSLDANITHLFKTKQRRAFDLKGYGTLSRYMQLFKYDGSSQEVPYVMTPAANLTCSCVNVSVPVQADIAFMATYISGNATWDVGYNFWARSCEKIGCPDCSCDSCDMGLVLNDATWAPGSTETTIHTITGSTVPATKIGVSDLDIEGARTKGLSHKIFTHIGYSWLKHQDWIPFIGLGIEGEFGTQRSGSSTNCCDGSSCGSCCSCALSQWGVWAKGGVSF